ncbi:threonine--tRNA ligase [Candidatus Micrarchaeota archaeon]|nr:threonine--tRNA ligase [Candidatus Micrarchaeota archaeon]
MRILTVHSDFIEVDVKKAAIKEPETLIDTWPKRFDEVLVAFTAVEKGDENVVETAGKLADEILGVANQVKCQNILLHPWVHLTSNPSSPKIAQEVLLKAQEIIKDRGFECSHSPFGWYKSFNIKSKGHPLSELSRQIGGFIEPGRKPKSGDAHTLNEVLYSVMLEEARNIGFAQDKNAYRITAALAFAVMAKQKHPGAKLGLPQLTEDGFSIDIDFGRAVSPKDLPEMLTNLKETISNKKIDQKLLKKKEAQELFTTSNEPYLSDLAKQMPEGTYLNVICVDGICLPSYIAPLDNISKLGALELVHSSGAYWLNDSSRAQLQRIYGLSFPKEEQLRNFLEMKEKAKDRDHRKLGQQLDLFSLQPVAPGMAFFHPKGMVIRNKVEEYLRHLNDKHGYVEIRTPIIVDADVWKESGHWDHYKENMYFTTIDGKLNGVKPMNCPGSIKVFKNSRRSYRELPLRLSEFGLVHRHEYSGVLSGLFRVRAFTQDDSHVYCTEEQIEEEVEKRLHYIDEFYSAFGFEYSLELSTRPPKRMGTDEQWDKAEAALRKALDKVGKTYKINEGDGAFYGPKIDFHIKDSLGRSWQCATEQLDFQMPLRFGVTYEDKDSKHKNPVILHSVAAGSIERFFAILVEHFEGKFPIWLSPTQIAVLTISDNQMRYGESIYSALKNAGIRTEIERQTGTIGSKIRDWQMQKVPYMIIIGAQEEEGKTISVRDRTGHETKGIKLDEFIKKVLAEIAAKDK